MERPWLVRIETTGRKFADVALPAAQACRKMGVMASCVSRRDGEKTFVDWEFPESQIAKDFRRKFGGFLLKLGRIPAR
jgi:hypothetical protein